MRVMSESFMSSELGVVTDVWSEVPERAGGGPKFMCRERGVGLGGPLEVVLFSRVAGLGPDGLPIPVLTILDAGLGPILDMELGPVGSLELLILLSNLDCGVSRGGSQYRSPVNRRLLGGLELELLSMRGSLGVEAGSVDDEIFWPPIIRISDPFKFRPDTSFGVMLMGVREPPALRKLPFKGVLESVPGVCELFTGVVELFPGVVLNGWTPEMADPSLPTASLVFDVEPR